jgi:hypothetical protein
LAHTAKAFVMRKATVKGLFKECSSPKAALLAIESIITNRLMQQRIYRVEGFKK